MNIRTVEIEGTNVQACAGTHCNKTGDVGLIKIIKTERIQDGIERIEFSAGEAAIKAVQNTDNILKESSSIYKVEVEQLPKTCDRFFNEWKSYKNEINKLKRQIASLKIASMVDEAEKINDLLIINKIVEADMGELIKIATELIETPVKVDLVIIGNNDGKIVGAASTKALNNNIKINELIKEAAKILGGGGGGKPMLAQGAGPKSEKMVEALDFIINKLKTYLK